MNSAALRRLVLRKKAGAAAVQDLLQMDRVRQSVAVKEALERLPNIGTVGVTRAVARTSRAGVTSLVDLEGGRRWMVTFFDPAGQVDALVASADDLTGAAASVEVDEVRPGFGVPALYNCSSFAIHHSVMTRTPCT